MSYSPGVILIYSFIFIALYINLITNVMLFEHNCLDNYIAFIPAMIELHVFSCLL
jgi:hypothetical protein